MKYDKLRVKTKDVGKHHRFVNGKCVRCGIEFEEFRMARKVRRRLSPVLKRLSRK